MRARLTMLSDSARSRLLVQAVQQVLTDVALAFGHSFLMKDEKMGQASLDAYGTPMTVETVEACVASDAVLVVTQNGEGMLSLAWGTGCSLACRPFALDQSWAAHSALKSGAMPSGLVVYPLSDEADAMGDAAIYAYKCAGKTQTPVCEIPFEGNLKEAWVGATKNAAAQHAAVERQIHTTEDALVRLLAEPDQLGVVLAKPGAASLLIAAASAISGVSGVFFDRYVSTDRVIQSVFVPEQGLPADMNPFGVLYAAQDLLRETLQLEREARCLGAAVANVLAAGWRTRDTALQGMRVTGYETICGLVSEQIALAGELMVK